MSSFSAVEMLQGGTGGLSVFELSCFSAVEILQGGTGVMSVFEPCHLSVLWRSCRVALGLCLYLNRVIFQCCGDPAGWHWGPVCI